jgi:hypothetical protein
VTLAERNEALGEVWHVPSAETITTRQFIELVFQQLQRPTRIQVAPKIMLSLLGLVIPALRAVNETLYQSERSWVVDHSKFARAFGAQPTPHPKAIAESISWFASRAAARQPARAPALLKSQAAPASMARMSFCEMPRLCASRR